MIRKHLVAGTTLTVCMFCLWMGLAWGQTFPETPTARLGKGTINEVAYSPDGKQVAVAGSLGIWLYNANDLTEIGLLKGHTQEVETISFSPDGQMLASGSRDTTIRLWNVEQQTQISRLQGHTAPVFSVAFSPDGKTLASASADFVGADNTVRLWDVDAQNQIGVLDEHIGPVLAVTFSPDGETLASGGGFDQTIRLWDVKRQRQIAVLQGHTGGVNGLAFSPDGRTLASGSDDETVRLWDVEREEEIGVLDEHTGWVRPVVFSPDGKILASGGSDNTIRLWDVEKQKQIKVLEEHLSTVWSASFSRGGKWLASGSEDGTIQLWEVNLPSPFPVEPKDKQFITLGGLKRDMLLQNFPNPFNPETWIPFQLVEEASVTIQIYSAQGKMVRQLKLGEKPAGRHATKENAAYWNGRNARGEMVASGVYFYRILAREFSATRRMLLAK